MSKLLIALMLAAGATSLAVGPVVAADKETRSYGQVNPADCKAAPPGAKDKAREKVAAGTATFTGQVDPADCKAEAATSKKSRAEVKKETKAAARAGELTPPGEVIKK